MALQLRGAFGNSIQVLAPDPTDGHQRIGMWFVATADANELATREATLLAMNLVTSPGWFAYWVSREVLSVIGDAQYAEFVKRQPGFKGSTVTVEPPDRVVTRAHVHVAQLDYVLYVTDRVSVEAGELHVKTSVSLDNVEDKPVSTWDPRGGPGAVLVASLPRRTASASAVTRFRFAGFEATPQGIQFTGVFGPQIRGPSFVEANNDRVLVTFSLDTTDLTAPQLTWSGGDVVYHPHAATTQIEFDLSAVGAGQTTRRTVRCAIAGGDILLEATHELLIERLGTPRPPPRTPRPGFRSDG